MTQNASLRYMVNDGDFVLYNFVRTTFGATTSPPPLPPPPCLLFFFFAFLFLHDDHILVHLLLIIEVLIIPSILYLNVRDQEILKRVWPKIIFYHFSNIILAGVHVILKPCAH